jgi:hypothetical protein
LAVLNFDWRRVSIVGLIVAVTGAASLASPWTISIPPAHLAQSFGFQTPLCWLAVVTLTASVVLEARAAVAAIGVGAAVLMAWFAWAMWIVTTPSFTRLPFTFVGTDVIGPGWYAAAIGLLLAAGAAVKVLVDRHTPVGAELWILTAIPGYGLMRLHRWGRGLAFALLVSGAIYFGSTDSPDASLFAEFGRSNNLPPPIPRGPAWVLLGLAAVLWLASIAATVLANRHRDSDARTVR